MRIGIIGTGRVGSALAAGWRRAGHEVQGAGRSGTPGAAEVADWAEIVVLAVPHGALEGLASDLSGAAGKPVLDCTNPITMGQNGMELSVGHRISGAEVLQGWMPQVRVVKTLNQVGAEVMADTGRFAHPPVQFMAGDDAAAKEVAAGLLCDLGFEPLDAGGLSKARLLEPFALVWINQAMARGHGRDWAFAALPRGAAQ